MLPERIRSLKQELIEYAALVESMVSKSVQGLLTHTDSILTEVIAVDEKNANEREVHIDEVVTSAIAQFQPAAKDLRTLLMILRMNTDLERMADHAVNIAESSLTLNQNTPQFTLGDLAYMAEATNAMLKDSIRSFVEENATIPQAVCERDTIVDNLRTSIMKRMVELMESQPSTIPPALQIIRIITNLERIADLSTNICEDVMYMIEGRVMKHHHDDAS